MNRALVPIILVILAVALFVIYTDSAYQQTKSINAELAQYNTALDQSEQVLALRDQLLAKRNALPEDGISKLQLLLPDNVDNIRLIIDINDIAVRYHLQVEGISLGGAQGASAKQIPGSAAPVSTAVGSANSPIGSVTLGFSVTASYNDFRAFLQDLERSLRLVDVTNVSFTSAGKDDDAYTMTITTYWLK